MDWTTEQIAELTRLWGEGLTGSEIGRRLGISKSAAVGKAHRLKLPGRPSPISRNGPKALRQIGKRAPTLKDPARPIQTGTVNGHSHAHAPLKPAPTPVEGASKPADISRIERYAALGTEKRQCQWPIGDPKSPEFRFCVEDRVVGKPYCAAHMAIATQGAPPVNAGAVEFFSSLHRQANSPYGAQDMGPIKAKGAA